MAPVEGNDQRAGMRFTARQLRAAFGELRSTVFGLDAAGNATFVSDRVADLLGAPAEAFEGINLVDVLHPDDLEFILEGITRWEGRPGSITGPRVRLKRVDGSYVDCTVDAAMGERVGPLGTLVAFIEEQDAEADLRQRIRQRVVNQDRLIRLVTCFLDGGEGGFDSGLTRALSELGTLEYATRVALLRLVEREPGIEGAPPSRLLVPLSQWTAAKGAPRTPLARHVDVSASQIGERLAALEEVHVPDVCDLGPGNAEARAYFDRAGVVAFFGFPVAIGGRLLGALTFETTVEPIELRPSQVTTLRTASGIMAEAMARRDARRTIEYRATHDAVTDLPNRASFTEMAREAVAGGGPETPVVAVLDIDGFKFINDTLGHEAGDSVLRHVADRLNSALWPGEAAGRLGGDTFGLLLSGPLNGARARADELVGSLAGAANLGEQAVRVRLSGAICEVADGDVAMAVAVAEEALATPDVTRGRSVVACDVPSRKRIRQRHETERELPLALRDGQLELYYQPEVDLRSGQVTGVEALLRWHHPTRGLLSAGEFITDVEHTPGFHPVGDWVVHKACEQQVAWDELGLPPLTMRLNLSAGQVTRPDLAQRLLAIVVQAGADPSRLCVELTETSLFAEPELALEQLAALRSAGVGLAVDDFGTGCWSLRSLIDLPLTILKLDRVLVAALDQPGAEADGVPIAAAVLALAEALGLGAVAEGVETPRQLAALRALGASRAQGFLFARPIPAQQLAERVSAGGAWIP